MQAKTATITMVGFGEAAHAFASGWTAGVRRGLRAYDLNAGRAAVKARCADHGLNCADTPVAALADAEVVFCLVTADQALAAAETCAPHLAAGALWLDGNSCAPDTKRKAAAVIEAAGGAYVDLAIMAPVHPRLHRTPGLIAGPNCARALDLAARLGMDWRRAGEEVGRASTIKMLRSVMVKGFEALTAECLLAARRAGVEGEVLASLQASDPGWNWRNRAAYNLERMMVHGARRAAEMEEVALTLRDLGLPDRMARATVDWQARLATLGLVGGPDDLADRADRILARLP
jgi:3-hydroxyisobutyrate dehydrogenase-like beta-hydroxyacid dehydrogenase